MIKLLNIVGLIEIGLISVIMLFSCLSLFVSYQNISYLISISSELQLPRPILYYISNSSQSLFFGIFGIIIFIIGLIGVIKLKKRQIWFSYVGLSLIIVWSIIVTVLASLGMNSHLDISFKSEGMIMGIIMIILSLSSLILLRIKKDFKKSI